MYSLTPSYISNLIKKRIILPSHHYQNVPLLISQISSKTSLNYRAFKNSGPTLWNSLPLIIRSIRSHKRFIILFLVFSISLITKHPTYYLSHFIFNVVLLTNCYRIICNNIIIVIPARAKI